MYELGLQKSGRWRWPMGGKTSARRVTSMTPVFGQLTCINEDLPYPEKAFLGWGKSKVTGAEMERLLVNHGSLTEFVGLKLVNCLRLAF